MMIVYLEIPEISLNLFRLEKFALNLLGMINRQALHAFKLSFEHPVKKEWINFSVALPEDFKNILGEINKLEGKL